METQLYGITPSGRKMSRTALPHPGIESPPLAIIVPAELEQSVQQLADRHGFAKEDFVRDAIEQRLDDYDAGPVLTEAQLARMREGIAQLDRGKYVTSEQVEAKFDKLFQRLEERAKLEEQAASTS